MQNRQIEINNSKEILYDDIFIHYINSLSDSIKEFYKVSLNVNNNFKIFINMIERELNISKITEINYNKLDFFNNYLANIKKIFNKFKLQVISEEKNLFSFFGDVKFIFKKLKEKQKEFILENKTNKKVLLNNKALSISNNCNNKISIKHFTKKINNNPFCLNMEYEDIKDNKFATIKHNKTFSNVRSQYFKKINEKYEKNQKNGNNINNFEYSLNNKNINMENKELNSRNINLSYKLNTPVNINKKKENKELKSTLKKKNNNNIHKKPNELIKNVNIYKKEIVELKKENIKLRKNVLSNLNTDNNNIINIKDCDKNLKPKLNSVIKENIALKQNIDTKKPSLLKTSNNLKAKIQNKENIFFHDNNFTQTNSNENKFLKKKINNKAKKLILNENKNDELNNEIILLSNINQSNFIQTSNKNSEILKNSNKNKNVLFSSKNKTINKEIKSVDNTKTIYDINYNYTLNSNESLNNIFKIVENYKKENEKIKRQNINFKDKIEYYQIEIKKNEK